MQTQDKYQLPDQPLPLDEPVEVSNEQREEIEPLLSDLSQAFDALPVVLSQAGEVVAAADTIGEGIAKQIAGIAQRLWRDGESHIAREIIEFDEIVLDQLDKRFGVMIYSLHVVGGLVLTLGWQQALSITQVRAEAKDLKDQILSMLDS